MGCIKKMLGVTELRDYSAPTLEFELNSATDGGGDLVHMQTAAWRIEMTEAEFKEFALTVHTAAEQLRRNKRLPR